MTSEHSPQDQQGGFETEGQLRRVEPGMEFELEAPATRGRPLLGIAVAVVAVVVVGLVIYFLVT